MLASRRRVWGGLAACLVVGLIGGCSDDPPPGGDDGVADMGGEVEMGTGGADQGVGAEVCPVTDFTSCGGDVEGTWSVVAFCPEDPAAADALCENPFSDTAACVGGENGRRCQWARSGTVRFAEGRVNTMLSARLDVEYTFSDACVLAREQGAEGAEAACLSLSNARLSCAYDDGVCVCTASLSPQDDSLDEAYTVDGATLTIGSGGEALTAAYCVEGDRLVMDVMPHPVSWRYWVLSR